MKGQEKRGGSGQMTGFCTHGNELTRPPKNVLGGGGVFLSWLGSQKLLKKTVLH
jgi:hypothetical protein